MKAVEVRRHGGPEVLELADVDTPAPADDEVLVKTAAAGVNFMDVHQRTGAGKYAESPPFVPGTEGAGEVIAVGAGVEDIGVGDRVAWKGARGSYAQQVAVAASQAIRIPEGLSDETAAASMLQGLTAQYLATSTFPVAQGDTVLVHAAAGGVGSLLTQIATLKGARVIATVSTADKEALARQDGAAEVIRYDRTELTSAVHELTGGEGVAAVFDGVGRDTFDAGLASLRPRGCMIVYGYSSGPIPPFDVQRLNAGGSLFLTRPSLVHYTRTREDLLMRTQELFGWIATGAIRIRVGARYPLADARRAHEDLEARRTTGKLLLLPPV
jgi:NADPH2:quinone reductase